MNGNAWSIYILSQIFLCCAVVYIGIVTGLRDTELFTITTLIVVYGALMALFADVRRKHVGK